MTGSHPASTRIGSPRFLSFLVVQFLGAANDNAFRMTLTLYVLDRVTVESSQLRYNGLATLLFPLPFLLFSPLAGYVADRFPKSRVVLAAKAPEILAMVLATAAFYADDLTFLLVVLFVMATQSAFFGPAKYGLLPEALAPRDLSMANGILEMTTNLAILIGAVSGALVFGRFRDDLAMAGALFLGVAVVGTVAATYVPRTPPGNPEAPFVWNLVAASRTARRVVRQTPVLSRTLLGIAYFGFLGSVFLTVIPVYGRNALGLSERDSGLLLMVLSIGIAIGSVVAGRLSSGRVEIGLVPLGSLGLTLFALDLALFGQTGWRFGNGLPLRAAIDLTALGVSAGFYVVPLNALLQRRSPTGMKGGVIAFSNVLTFGAVFLAGLLSIAVTSLLGLSAEQLVLIMASLTVLATLYVLNLLPDALVRLVLWTLTHTVYRVEVHGEAHLPRGGGLLVANHVSWVDALLVGASTDRIPRFLMFRPYYQTPGLRWFFRRMHVIPVAAGDSPEDKEASLAQARREIERGHLVCIFAEGAITRTGNLLRFKRGFENIADGSEGPIVPVYLGGVWGSVFSWEGGRLLFKWPRRVRQAVRVVFGPAMPPTAKAFEVRERIQELSVQAFEHDQATRNTLFEEFVVTARRFWSRPFAADDAGRSVTFGDALTAVASVARSELGPDLRSRPRIGVLLPPGVPAALANLGVLAAGRAVVDLDADGGPDLVRREIEHAGIDVVVTSRDHLANTGLSDALDGVTVVELPIQPNGIAWRWMCRWLPRRTLAARLGDGPAQEPGETAVVVFSSAPHLSGAIAAVELSHHNILANLESLRQVFRISRDDRILGALPFSTTYGLTGTLFLPAVAGIPVVYNARGADAESLNALASRLRPTVLPLAASHLAALVRAGQRQSFSAVRHVVVAGKGLDAALLRSFTAKFGVEPLEGFGCAECAPLVSLNVPGAVRGLRGQEAHRPGTIGHPVPGVAVRITDPDTEESLPPGTAGQLRVMGPNVMRGYLHDPAATAEVIRNGWYRTGFHAVQDVDGFLTLTEPRRDGPEPR